MILTGRIIVSRRPLAALLLLTSSVGISGSTAPNQRVVTPVSPKVPDKIETAAQPFPPEAVRLLDSPFKDAMARDQAYLLSLDPDRLLRPARGLRPHP